MPRKNAKKAVKATTADDAPEPKAKGFEENMVRVAAPESGTATVSVALKIPNGIVLRLQHKEKVTYPVMGGGFHEEVQSRVDPEAKTYTLYGNRVPFGEQARCMIIGGYAITPGIPKAFWELWLEQNKKLDLVVNGLIKAHASLSYIQDFAKDKDNRAVRSGMEAIVPDKDPRLPKRKNNRTGKMEDAIFTADEQPAA